MSSLPTSSVGVWSCVRINSASSKRGSNPVRYARLAKCSRSEDTIQYTAGVVNQDVQQFGALMFWAHSGSINAPFTVSSDEIDNSQYAAISSPETVKGALMEPLCAQNMSAPNCWTS